MSHSPNTMKRKAQASASGASTLIIIILLILVLYILFLPPQTREELLSGDNDSSTSSSSEPSILLSENPGTLEYIKDDEISHTIPALTVYTQTNALMLAQKESALVKTSIFGQKTLSLTFQIDDVKNTKKVLISSNILKKNGNLIVVLNGFEVFNGPVSSPNMQPIDLPVEYLKATNEVVLSGAPVGGAFWAVNSFQFQNLKVTADVEDVKSREASGSFLVSRTEKENVDETVLRFFADCIPSQVGNLVISVNDHQILNQVPDCGVRVTQPISPEYLKIGENKLKFVTEKGVYAVYSAEIKSKLREISNPVYYFELDNSEYADVVNFAKVLKLNMTFVDDIAEKKADIVVNGHMIRLEDDEISFGYDISNYAKEKTNGIKIIPLSTLDVVELKVVLE